MMIEFTEGNLLNSNAEALVDTVNTVGVMGKGIALMFKDSLPENFKEYQAACSAKKESASGQDVCNTPKCLGSKMDH